MVGRGDTRSEGELGRGDVAAAGGGTAAGGLAAESRRASRLQLRCLACPGGGGTSRCGGAGRRAPAPAPAPARNAGIFGTYPDAVLPGLHVVEGGQTSTGSILNW